VDELNIKIETLDKISKIDAVLTLHELFGIFYIYDERISRL
jgi:hypothetical protein